MRSPDYTRLSEQLPALYRDDAVSFAQLDAYLGLADELGEQIVAALDDLPLTLGPDAALRWPYALPLDAGSDALIASLIATYDELAQWVGFRVPSSWGTGADGIIRRRTFLARSARLWRRRGTPRGFLDWFCVYFGIEADKDRPVVIEHYKLPTGPFADKRFTASLLVPGEGTFATYQSRLDADEFLRRYTPAHLALRICYVTADIFADWHTFESPPTLAAHPSATAVTTYRNEFVARAAKVSELLCTVVSIVDHANALHATKAGVDARPNDHLGVGLLPHDGD